MAEAIEGLGDLAAPVPPPTTLMRTHRIVQMVFIILILVLNVLALLELFKLL